MIRKILLVSAGAAALAMTSHAETRTFDTGPFTGIDVSAGIDVTFAAGGPLSVSVENKKNDFSDIKVSVRDGDLHLERKKRMAWGKRQSYLVTVSAPEIFRIDASSGASVTGTGLSGDGATVDVSSGADAVLASVSAGEIALSASSGASLTAAGTCETVISQSSSGADIDASDLACLRGVAEASSGASTAIRVSQSIIAQASSGGGIDVHGMPPEVETETSSGGDVSLRGGS